MENRNFGRIDEELRLQFHFEILFESASYKIRDRREPAFRTFGHYHGFRHETIEIRFGNDGDRNFVEFGLIPKTEFETVRSHRFTKEAFLVRLIRNSCVGMHVRNEFVDRDSKNFTIVRLDYFEKRRIERIFDFFVDKQGDDTGTGHVSEETFCVAVVRRNAVESDLVPQRSRQFENPGAFARN